jgi:ABC-type nitrate/sulfonate/bicarbonate transport system substrate-binding protein
MGTQRPFLGLPGLFMALLLFVVWGSTPALASVTPQKKAKPLSLANVTIQGPSTGNGMPTWVGMYDGIFSKLGMNVSYITSAVGSTSAITTLIAGAAQFIQTSSGSGFAAVAEGAPIRAIEMDETGTVTVLTISDTFGAAHNIPTNGSTANGALGQLLALKGSHITVGISSASSSSYEDINSAALDHGMTAGINCTTCDIDFVSLGSAAVLVAGEQSGKVAGFANSPPISSLEAPGTFEIQIGKIAPLSEIANNYISTLTSVIQQHPDTVQAITTAYVEIAKYIGQHPTAAEHAEAEGLANFAGITSPEEVDALFAFDSPTYSKTQYPTKAAFNLANAELSQASSALAITYNTWVDLRFIKVTLKEFPQDFPKNATG